MGVFDSHAAGSQRSRSWHIDAADVIALLQEVYADGITNPEEAEELIAFDQTLTEPTAGWNAFFATTIADHVLHRQPPVLVIDGPKTAWLTAVLTKNRHATTPGGFGAVLHLIERATDTTPELAAFAIRQIRSTVLAGRRPASTARLFLKRAIDSETAVLVRRIVCGSPAQSMRPVTRVEAQALFDLHDLTARAENDADFDDLFFKAVAHHLIAETGHHVPSRYEALARHASFPHGAGETAPLGPEETAWLASQIMRDGRPTTAEFALLQFFTGRTAGAGLMIQAA